MLTRHLHNMIMTVYVHDYINDLIDHLNAQWLHHDY